MPQQRTQLRSAQGTWPWRTLLPQLWSLLYFFSHANSTVVNVTTGRELVMALNHPLADEILVVVPKLTVSGRDFDGIAGLPLRVSRNVTLTGASADPVSWPRVSVEKAADLVQIGNGVVLTFTWIFLRQADWDEATFRSPRFPLFAPTPRGRKAVWNLRSTGLQYPYGFDASIFLPYTNSFPRPLEISGRQQYEAVPEPKPPFSEWRTVYYVVDSALETSVLDPAGGVQSLNYLTLTRDSWIVIDVIISSECIAANRGDPVPCFLLEVKGVNPDGTVTINGTLGGNSSTRAGRDPTDSSTGASSSPSSVSGGPATGQIVGAVVGGVIGGLVVLAAAVYAWVAWRRRRAYSRSSCSGRLPEQEKGMPAAAAGNATHGSWPWQGAGDGNCCPKVVGSTAGPPSAGAASGKGIDGARVSVATMAGGAAASAAVATGETAAGADGSSRLPLQQGAKTARTTTTTTNTTTCSSSDQPMQWATLGRMGGSDSGAGSGGVGGDGAGHSSGPPPQPTGDGGGGTATAAHVDLRSAGGCEARGGSWVPQPSTVAALVAAEAGSDSTAMSGGGAGLGGSQGLGLSGEMVGYRTPFRHGLELNVEVDDGLDGALLATDNTGLDRVISIAGGGSGAGAAALLAGQHGGAAAQAAVAGAAGAGGVGAAGGLVARASRKRLPPSGPDVVEVLPIVLGKGSYGRVFEGRYRGMRVAVKQMLTASGPFGVVAQSAAAAGAGRGAEEDLEAIEAFAQEVDVLGRCDHPNIARLYAACLTRPKLALVMELADTSLDKLVYRQYAGSLMPLRKVLHIAAQIAQGLGYLHPFIVHRDLKPANVLINNPTSDTPDVKLADFGLARIYESTMPTASPEAGTAAYIAPECFDVTNNVVTHRADIYSFGVVVWTMLSGEEPWKDTPGIVEIAVRLTVRKERLPLSAEALGPDRYPPRLQRLLMSCWEEDPLRRPAAADLAKMLVLMREELSQE